MSTASNMQILILGAGGVGGYFGGRLVESGADVTFLVRPNRAIQLRRNGLTIYSSLGNVNTKVHVEEEASQPRDLIILACKATGLQGAIEAVRPAIGPDTIVLPLLNGIRHLELLDARLPQAQILGGLCHIGVTVDDNGDIRHLNDLQHIALGARHPEQEPAAKLAHTALSRGRITPVHSIDITRDMWEKFVFLASYAGLTCLMRAPVGVIAATEFGKAIAAELLEECAAVAAAFGFRPSAKFMQTSLATLTDEQSAGAASMLRDLQNGRKTEQDHILGDMVGRAHAAGIVTPILRLARTHMQAYETTRSDFGEQHMT